VPWFSPPSSQLYCSPTELQYGAQRTLNLKSFVATGFMNKVATEWNTQPYINITVVKTKYCPLEFPELVFDRMFYGSDFGCNCLGIFDSDVSVPNQLEAQFTCGYNETIAGCGEVYGIPPIRMGQFDTHRICGKRGGQPFVSATHPDLQTR